MEDNSILCTKCKIYQPTQNFYKCSTKPRGYSSHCKSCRAEYKKGYKEKEREKAKQRYRKNPEKYRKKARQWYRNRSEKSKQNLRDYRLKNKEKTNAHKREWRKNNPEQAKLKDRRDKLKNIEKAKLRNRRHYLKNKDKILAYRREKRKNNPAFNLRCSLSSGLGYRLKRQGSTPKLDSSMDLTGCKSRKLSEYIENQFINEMSWEKYKNREIEIDHILPFSSFDITKLQEQHRVCHYTNLRPLWRYENRLKQVEDQRIGKIIKNLLSVNKFLERDYLFQNKFKKCNWINKQDHNNSLNTKYIQQIRVQNTF